MGQSFIDLFLIAMALSMDAFSVSLSCGIKLKKNNYKLIIPSRKELNLLDDKSISKFIDKYNE